MTFEELAQSVAWRWHNPGDKPRTHPPVATLEYMAEKAYCQAKNLCGFPGDGEAWYDLVRSSLPISTPPPASGRQLPDLTPATVPAQAVPGTPPASSYLEDL